MIVPWYPTVACVYAPVSSFCSLYFLPVPHLPVFLLLKCVLSWFLSWFSFGFSTKHSYKLFGGMDTFILSFCSLPLSVCHLIFLFRKFRVSLY